MFLRRPVSDTLPEPLGDSWSLLGWCGRWVEEALGKALDCSWLPLGPSWELLGPNRTAQESPRTRTLKLPRASQERRRLGRTSDGWSSRPSGTIPALNLDPIGPKMGTTMRHFSISLSHTPFAFNRYYAVLSGLQGWGRRARYGLLCGGPWGNLVSWPCWLCTVRLTWVDVGVSDNVD